MDPPARPFTGLPRLRGAIKNWPIFFSMNQSKHCDSMNPFEALYFSICAINGSTKGHRWLENERDPNGGGMYEFSGNLSE
jgi:hypothetical protein